MSQYIYLQFKTKNKKIFAASGPNISLRKGICNLTGFFQNCPLTSRFRAHRPVNPFFPTVPTCAVRETQFLGQYMLELSCENATLGTNGLIGHGV